MIALMLGNQPVANSIFSAILAAFELSVVWGNKEIWTTGFNRNHGHCVAIEPQFHGAFLTLGIFEANLVITLT
jgi:hypothetical protein